MPTFTDYMNYALPIPGGDSDSWGALLNQNWEATDAKLEAMSSDISDRVLSSQLISLVVASIYPIGSILLTATPTNPATYLPGTNWVQKAEGRALVGVGSAEGETWALNEEKGVPTVTLTEDQIPSHDHEIDPLPQSFTTDSDTHNHTINPPSTTTSRDGTHQHVYLDSTILTSGNRWDTTEDSNEQDNVDVARTTDPAGDHFHTVDIPTFNSSSDTHSHSVNVDISAFDSGKTGGSNSHTNIQPSIAVFVWERVS